MSDMNIKGMLDAQGRAYEALKAEVENVKADSAKIARIESTLDEVAAKLEEATLKAGRPGASASNNGMSEVKEAFLTFVQKGERALTPEQVKTLSITGTDPKDGSFSVPEEFEAGIIKKVFEHNPMRQEANVTSTGTKDKTFLYEEGDFGAGWVTELQARTETATMKIGEIVIPVHELAAEPRATRPILADSFLNLESWINENVAKKLARVEALAFVSGNGTGQASGLISAGVTAADATQTSIAKLVGAEATQLDDILDQVYALAPEYATNAKFMVSRLRLAELRKQRDANGQFLWQPAVAAGQPSTFMGFEVVVNDVLAATQVVFGDLKQAYTVVDRPGSMTMIRDEFTEKQFIKFYTTYRVGGAVTNGFAASVLNIA